MALLSEVSRGRRGGPRRGAGPFSPFVGQHGIDHLVGPLPLHPLVLHQVGLAPHAQALEDAGRRGVPGIDLSEDPVDPEFTEGQIDDRTRRFGRQSLTLRRGMEDVADLGLPMALLRGFALLARTAGLLGQLAEEQRHPIGMDIYLAVDRNADYSPPVPPEQ